MHRDVTPANILFFDEDETRRWVVADWGLVRRPLGKTSTPLTSRAHLGTQGYIAPEVFTTDAHSVTPAADVYSLGCVAGWALTGTDPAPGVPALPQGRWRSFLRRATATDPRRRIADMEAFRAEVLTLMKPLGKTPSQQREVLVRDAKAGDSSAAKALLDLALTAPDDVALHLDALPEVQNKVLRQLLRDRREDILQVATSMVHHAHNNWGNRNFRQLDEILLWLLSSMQAAEKLRDFDALEDLAALFFECCEWDQWPLYGPVKTWLRSLNNDAQHAVAAALRQSPGGRAWLTDRVEVNLDDRPILYATLHEA